MVQYILLVVYIYILVNNPSRLRLAGEDFQEFGRQIAVSLRGGVVRRAIAATREHEPHADGVDGNLVLRAGPYVVYHA